MLPIFPNQVNHPPLFGSQPEYQLGMGWHIFVAMSASHGILVGLSIKRDDTISYGQPVADNNICLWIGSNNTLLLFWFFSEPLPKALVSQWKKMPSYNDWQEISGDYILRTQLRGFGWQPIILYPTESILSKPLHGLCPKFLLFWRYFFY